MFWRSRNYEKELELLANKVRKARSSAQKAKLNNRRYRSLFILYAIGIYTVYFAVSLSTKSIRNTETKLYLLISPLIIYSLYRVLALWLGWRQSTTANHLKAVEDTREGLVQEYKEKVNYSHIQKVLASGAESDTATTTGSKQETPTKGRTQRGQPQKAQKHAAKTPSKNPLQQQQSKLSLKDQIKRENGVWPQQVQPQPEVTQGHLNPPMPMPPSMPTSPVAPTKHSWMDRVADLVLGENEMGPNSRYALICPVCHAHNGLAQYGENPSEVVYRCPYCGTLNGKSDQAESSKENSTEQVKNQPKTPKSPDMKEAPKK